MYGSESTAAPKPAFEMGKFLRIHMDHSADAQCRPGVGTSVLPIRRQHAKGDSGTMRTAEELNFPSHRNPKAWFAYSIGG